MIESILNFLQHYVATELEVADVEEKRRKIKKTIPDFLKKKKPHCLEKKVFVSTDSAPYLNYIYLINLISNGGSVDYICVLQFYFTQNCL